MKGKRFAGIAVLAALLTWGCNQSGSGKQEGNEHEQPQKEQKQMPDQSNRFQQQQPQATEVSDKELRKFAMAAQQVQVINQETQQEMIRAVEEKGLDAQRFSELQQAQQNPQQGIDATDEEVKKYEAASRELEKIRGKANQKMQEKIAEAGLKLPRYEEIAMTLQSDPNLQKKFQTIQQRNN